MKRSRQLVRLPQPGAPADHGPPAVVGIGASAGGLKALQLFFDAVTPDSGMAYVVIMHLDPVRESRMAEILQSRTALPVRQVNGTTAVEADHVYIIAPGHDLEIGPDGLRLVERGDRPLHLPVDLFFRTLATAYGSDSIGVVLSGTGTDGTAGMRYIKEVGGITVAQAPDEADHEGMPTSAIATGQVDLVLPAAEIGPELLRLRRAPSPLAAGAAWWDGEDVLARLFSTLRAKTGHDFSLYKRSTVVRRLERRLRFNDVKTLEEYLPLLRDGERESRALLRDLLISVSGFFRDAAAFAAMEKVVPTLFEGKGPDDTVRVWVVGCATGEEAYSILILLSEHAATLEHPPQIQMFATDIDEKGYAWGRDALYPASAVAEIPPERLRRYFTQEGGGYRVKKSLREGVLFAVHNVLHDPPFSRVDLISCRNLLIYLQPEAQAQVIETFHYALRGGGVLFLGGSESAGESPLFVPIARQERIYLRDATLRPVQPRPSARDLTSRPLAAQSALVAHPRAPDFSYGALHLRMLEVYTPPSLVVDERMEVVHLSEGAGPYLRLREGEPTHNLIELASGGLRTELRTALYQAFEKGLPSTRRVAADEAGGRAVRVRVHPPMKDEKAGKFALVVFEDQQRQEPDPEDAGAGVHRQAVARLEKELGRTKEQLESMSVARDYTVQALQAANEELQSVGEEDRAATEELETSREEIQSINEELTSINQEHQHTIEELKRTNADLQNLVESAEIGTIFLDRELSIRRFTPSVAALFNFVTSDLGRPLHHITHRLIFPGLMEDARAVLASQQRLEREVPSQDGEWYVVRFTPYRPFDLADAAEGGVVLTFFNITAQKRVEVELREAKKVAESANLAKGTFLGTLSHEFRTPLNAMLGYAGLLDLDGPLTPAQVRKVDRIKAGGLHLALMIDEILTFAKLDEGRESVRAEALDARVVAHEAQELVEPAAHAKGLSFVLDLPGEAVPLETDGGKLRQVLINLCGNAVKYTEQGEIRLRVRAEGESVVFEVRDTGMGIAEEHQAHIFERFWQVDGASTRSFGGMGIGLAAAREFSRLLGGDVEVESRAGEGSTFRVRLPDGRRAAEAMERTEDT
jgi:two-component system CheB/CheR fusion protein